MDQARTGSFTTFMRRLRRIPVERRIIILAFVGGFLAAVILVAAGLIFPSKPPDIWPEVVKAGVQVGVVTLLGAGITLLLTRAQSIREDRRRADEKARKEDQLKAEYRLGVFRDVVTAYNGVKSVRRVLRALGLKQPPDRQGFGLKHHALSAEQAVRFHEQMGSLVQSQLSLERIVRELNARPSWFHHAHDLKCEMDKAEKYVNRIVDEWEKRGSEIISGAPTSRVESLQRLQAFLGDADADLKPNFSRRLEELEKNIRVDLYGDERVASDS